MGAELIPYVNAFANRLNDFTFYEQNFQVRQFYCAMTVIVEMIVKDGHLIYPGDEWCNPQQPHSKWHLQSGIGLLDLVYLCDNMYQLTGSQ